MLAAFAAFLSSSPGFTAHHRVDSLRLHVTNNTADENIKAENNNNNANDTHNTTDEVRELTIAVYILVVIVAALVLSTVVLLVKWSCQGSTKARAARPTQHECDCQSRLRPLQKVVEDTGSPSSHLLLGDHVQEKTNTEPDDRSSTAYVTVDTHKVLQNGCGLGECIDDEFYDAWSPGNTPSSCKHSGQFLHV